MTKNILIEKRSGALNYINESGTRDGKTYLGRIEGIASDFKNPTRNGRRYPLELWKKVENSDDFKEGMSTLTLFGENDHPETRVDASIKEASIVLTDFIIKEDEGIVWCGFDILPTPAGHILKTILDYGSKIGVSSRGLGDEVQRDGETIIDPDTYEFYGFDAVVMPAVKTARPPVVESVNRKKLADKLQEDIDNSTTEVELSAIKKVVESTKLPELDSLLESINIKLNGLKEGDDISSKLEADLGALAQDNESLKSKVADLESKLSASNTRLTETKEVLSNTRDMTKSLTRELMQSNELVSSLKKESVRLKSELLESRKLLDSTKRDIVKSESRIKSITMRLENSNSELHESKSKNEELCRQNEKYSNEVSRLSSLNRNLTLSIESSKKKIKELSDATRLTESKQSNISKKLTECSNKLSSVTSKYIQTKCSQEGISYEHVMTRLRKDSSVEEIDKIISEMSDQNQRFAKVPIALKSREAVLVESTDTNGRISDPSDNQTIEFLKSFK